MTTEQLAQQERGRRGRRRKMTTLAPHYCPTSIYTAETPPTSLLR